MLCVMLLLTSTCSMSWGMAPNGELPASSTLEENSIGPSSCITAYINITYIGSDGEVRSDNSETGKYGETFVGSAAGVLVHVRSRDTGEPMACTLPLTTNSTVDHKLPLSEPWIALIKRGNCDFAVKVKHALRYNASAVLIYNDREAPTLDKMSIPPDLRNISAVFTFKKKGEFLANLADAGIQVMTYITVGKQCNGIPNNINKAGSFRLRLSICDPDLPSGHCVHLTSVLFVSISFIVLMIISLAWLVFYYVQRFRYIHAKDRLSRRLCSAAKKALSKIPTKNIKSEDKEIQGDGECCAVCIEPYKVSDVLRILPCRHEFHKYCIDPWLLEHRTCPMCKMDILKHYGFVFTGSQESILHMDIEEVASLESSVNNDTDRLQRRTLTPISEITQSEHQGSSSASPDDQSQSSRASSPDELTPTLCSEQCYAAATSRAGDSPSLMETSTHYSTAPADAHHKPEKCDTSYKCECELTQTPSCDMEDCELDSCDSLSASPSHVSSGK